MDRRKSQDLSRERTLPVSSDAKVENEGCCANGIADRDTSPRRETNTPDKSQDSTDQGPRYPLFIQVEDSPQAQVKPRGAKQTPGRKPSTPAKQSSLAAQRIPPPRRSASFTSPRKPSNSDNSSPRGTGNQSQSRGTFRREKSDVVTTGRAQSHLASQIPRKTRSSSSASLKSDSSDLVRSRSQLTVSPRRCSPSSCGIRREKSDVVRPRRVQRNPSPIDSCHQPVKGARSSQSLANRSSGNSADRSRWRSNSNSEMSKIPSLKRTPVSSEKQQTQISRIPSLTKQHSPAEHARTPPKSKIPSISKGDYRNQEKKSQIPSAVKNDKDTPKLSKIPSFVSSSQGRPDSAKENQDPSASEVDGSGSGQQETPSGSKSRIPSFTKKSRIPSVSRKDSSGIKSGETASSPEPRDDAEHGPQNGDVEHLVNGGTREASEDSSKTKTRPSFSRIPSLTRASAPKEEPKPKSNNPAPVSAPAGKVPSSNVSVASKIPGSRNPEPKQVGIEKIVPSSLPTVSKPSGILKPGSVQSPLADPPSSKPSGIQSPVSQPISGIPKPARVQSPAAQSPSAGSKIPLTSQAHSKLPQLSRKDSAGEKQPSRLPSLSGAAATRKMSETEKEAKTDIAKAAGDVSRLPVFSKANVSADNGRISEVSGRQPSGLESGEAVVDKKDTELTETSANFEETEASLVDNCITYEAQRVEKLLREGHVIVEVPMEVHEGNDSDAEREEGMADDATETPEIPSQDETLISDVLKSYAPDLADKETSSVLESRIPELAKDSNGHIEGKLSLDDIYVQAFENEMAKTKLEPAKKEMDHSETVLATKEEKERKENEKEDVEKNSQTKAEPRTPDAELPAVDTLGGYEQHSRRARSRQRKVVSPDAEESENEQTVSKAEQTKKSIDKDKFGTAPFGTEKKTKENAKPTKSKSKNEKTKFVVESSLGKDFYESKKTESKESISDLPTVSKPEETSVIIENKNIQEPIFISPPVETVEAAEFEDIDLNSLDTRREISRSVDDLDEKTVKCMGCGRGGKCSIM